MTLTRALRLLSATAMTATTTGTELEISSGRDDATRFMGRLRVNCNSGTPTLDVVIQHRAANDTASSAWKDFIIFDQVTTETDHVKEVPQVSIAVMPHFIFRAVATAAGTSPNYDLTVDLWYGPG